MKTKIITHCPLCFVFRLRLSAFYLLPSYLLFFIFSAFCLSSCSSSVNEENKSISKNMVKADTSLNGVTGIIEKNPPVVNGDYTAKYPSGIVKMKGFYVKGKREGQWISFFENGKIQSEGFFKDGLRDGKALVYYENGKLYYEGYYNQGKEVGKWVFYDTEGNRVNEKDYGNKPNS